MKYWIILYVDEGGYEVKVAQVAASDILSALAFVGKPPHSIVSAQVANTPAGVEDTIGRWNL